MIEKLCSITSRALLAFVLISIGFVLGKEATLRQTNQPAAQDAGTEAVAGGEFTAAEEGRRVVVYYLHASFRCITCNTIELLARTLVEEQFAHALADGRLEWHEANFQHNPAMAQRYGVASACVVITTVENGQETGFKRMDDVWTLYRNPDSFNEYIGAAIAEALAALENRSGAS